jgi:L-lysine 2,3-aminomutase
VEPLLEIPHLRNIRIGSKALAYWPYRFLTDPDAEDLLSLFRKVHQAGKHLALMAHFNHPNELKTEAVKQATQRVRDTGAQIRTQSPLLRHINDDSDTWAELWKMQVEMGMVPYYMFVVRDTGAQHYFAVPLVEAWRIFRNAYNQVSGLSRTVRGPSMSCDPGKVQVDGVMEVHGERVIVLKAIQGRNPDWVGRPFFAQYDERAIWLDDLKPAFGEASFFYEEELERMYRKDQAVASGSDS